MSEKKDDETLLNKVFVGILFVAILPYILAIWLGYKVLKVTGIIDTAVFQKLIEFFAQLLRYAVLLFVVCGVVMAVFTILNTSTGNRAGYDSEYYRR